MKQRGSLTVRLLLLAAINLLLLAAAAAAFVTWQIRQEFDSFLLAGGGDRVRAVQRAIVEELTADPDAREAVLARRSKEDGVAFMLVLNDGTHIGGPHMTIPDDVLARLRPPGARQGGRLPAPPPGPLPRQLELFLVRSRGTPQYWIGARTPIPQRGDPTPGLPGTLLIASERFLGNPYLFQPLPWIGLVTVALLISAACWLPWISGVTRAIRRIEAATASIADGRFDVKLDDVRRDDELGGLASGVKEMAFRLAALMGAQKRFLSDAAHELRSPLARMQVAIELLEAQPPERRDQYLADIREDLDEMRRITDALLEVGRNELQPNTRVELIAIDDVVKRAVEREGRGANVDVSGAPGVEVLANREQLSRAVANLVRNAVFYAGDAGPVEVRSIAQNGHVRVIVADHGPGVPAKDLPHLFTPFYRIDGSRDRRSGGTGLGLAIVRTAVEGSGGSVSCRNREPNGLEVTITLPTAHA